jgi:AAA15 family ATPase/GTPase
LIEDKSDRFRSDTSMYKSIEIENFRGISNLKIDDFQRINLLVGKNNCGKTSVLEALFVHSNPGSPDFSFLANRDIRKIKSSSEYFWSSLFYNLDSDIKIKLSGGLLESGEFWSTTIEARYGNGEESKRGLMEGSRVLNGIILNTTFEMPGEYPVNATSSVFLRKNKKVPDLKGFLSEKINIRYYYEENIEDIAKKFGDLEMRKEASEIKDFIRTIDPRIKDLRTVYREANVYCDLGLKRLVPLNVMGNGLIRLLYLLLNIYEKSDSILLIDEIENGLHYTSQRTLWKGIFEAAKRFNVQIIATTHSYDCIRTFSSAISDESFENDTRLFRIEKKDEVFRVEKYDYEALDATLENDWEMR